MTHVVLKFIQELLPQLITIIYASNSADVQTAINTAKRLKRELLLAIQH